MLSEPEIQDGGGRAMGGIRRGKVRTMYTYVIKKKVFMHAPNPIRGSEISENERREG